MGNQETSLSWSEWKVTRRLLYLGNLRQLPTKDQSLRLDFEWLVLCCSTILRCVIFLSLFLDLNLLFRKETHWFFVVLWIFFFFAITYSSSSSFFSRFEIWNFLWKVSPFVLDHPWKFIFLPSKLKISSNWYHLSLKSLKASSSFFFFLVSWLSQLSQTSADSATRVWQKGGRGGANFWPPLCLSPFFFFF